MMTGMAVARDYRYCLKRYQTQKLRKIRNLQQLLEEQENFQTASYRGAYIIPSELLIRQVLSFQYI
jgi:hypothetical protein